MIECEPVKRESQTFTSYILADDSAADAHLCCHPLVLSSEQAKAASGSLHCSSVVPTPGTCGETAKVVTSVYPSKSFAKIMRTLHVYNILIRHAHVLYTGSHTCAALRVISSPVIATLPALWEESLLPTAQPITMRAVCSSLVNTDRRLLQIATHLFDILGHDDYKSSPCPFSITRLCCLPLLWKPARKVKIPPRLRRKSAALCSLCSGRSPSTLPVSSAVFCHRPMSRCSFRRDPPPTTWQGANLLRHPDFVLIVHLTKMFLSSAVFMFNDEAVSVVSTLP
ncbi:hypothetical protein J6590_055877 [Homalodisca vitripennis]|nr:hypothetical protein J6590_055877 [Homalodisca vitripennis]